MKILLKAGFRPEACRNDNINLTGMASVLDTVIPRLNRLERFELLKAGPKGSGQEPGIMLLSGIHLSMQGATPCMRGFNHES